MYSFDFSANESVVYLKLTLQNQVVNSVHRVYLCSVYGFQKEQRFFPHTSLTGWLIYSETESVYCAVRNEYLTTIIQISLILGRVSTVTE